MIDGRHRFTCCICGKEVIGYGNDPYPIAEDGDCCDECNMKYVVSKRLENLFKHLERKEVDAIGK